MERLRDHLRRHNRWVLILTILTFLLSVVLWYALYLAVLWLFLIAETVTRPFDIQPASGAPVRDFAAGAVLLCLAAWIARKLRPNAMPRDHKGYSEHFLDVLLAVPRLTLSILGTGGAAARLNDSEMEQAWLLLRRMSQSESPMPVHALPVDIPDSAMRAKILLTLQLSGLIEIRPTSSGPVLAFQNQKARRLAQERVRLRF
jgi:hypothetical protein